MRSTTINANVNVYFHDKDLHDKVDAINNKLKSIIMTNAELVTKLQEDGVKLDKIITEIQALKDKANTTPDVPQDIVDAVNSLDAKLTAADDMNEDAPVV